MDKVAGGGLKRVEKATGEAAGVDYLAAFQLYFYIRNLNWNETFEYEREEMWNGQLWTLYKFLPTQYTMADWDNFQILSHGGTFYG